MFVWIGCQLPEAFAQEIRGLCLTHNEKIGLNTVAFALPQHISLKISFDTDRQEAVLEEIAEYLSGQIPFAVCIRNPERAGNILWMPVAENTQLQRLHRELDERLEHKFGIAQHPFDKAFLFHSTLFLDENGDKIGQMAAVLRDHAIGRELLIDTFLLGVSETGKAGDYRIVRQIHV